MLLIAILFRDLFSPWSPRRNYDLFQTEPTTYVARLASGFPAESWSESIFRKTEIRRQSLAAFGGRADCRKRIAAAKKKVLGKVGNQQQTFVFANLVLTEIISCRLS
jgi:hypothetical protein